MAWDQFTKKAEEVSAERLASVFEWVNDTLRESLVLGQPVGGLSVQSMCRLLLFMSIGISDAKRQSKKTTSQSNAVSWTELSNEINKFSGKLPNSISKSICRSFTDDKVSQLATISTRQKGSNEPYFYTTILLFLIKRYTDGYFDTEFFHRMCSKEDRSYPIRSLSVLIDKFNFGIVADHESKTRELRPLFMIKDEIYGKFADYFSTCSIESSRKDKRKQLQVVMYRPMRSDPLSVMKTYLSVYEQGDSYAEQSSFTYTHIYKPPQSIQEDRFSGGKLLTLDDAIYLVGGQRPLSLRREALPFSSLKVMVIRWIDIERRHALFPMLIMSTNYGGRPIVSRAAGRLTPVDNSKKVELGSVKFDDLESDLAVDRKVEQQVLTELTSAGAKSHMDSLFPIADKGTNLNEVARQISFFCNNDPHTLGGWAVPSGYTKQTVPSGRRSRTETKNLTSEALSFLVSDALGEGTESQFKNETNEPYNIWLNTRFGPLGLE